jgi:gluconolactonase
MKYLLLLTVLLTAALSTDAGHPRSGKPLYANGEKVNLAGGGFAFTEGPSAARDGSIWFTDQPNNKILIWRENGSLIPFTLEAQRSNGTFFNRKGDLVACADQYNRLVSFSPDQEITVLAENYNGKHFNGPNDLWIAPGGGIYFSDPYYHRDYWEPGHKEVQDTRGVYYLSPDRKLIRVIGDFKQPNGLIGTPDGKTLYVSDINDGKIWK